MINELTQNAETMKTMLRQSVEACVAVTYEAIEILKDQEERINELEKQISTLLSTPLDKGV